MGVQIIKATQPRTGGGHSQSVITPQPLRTACYARVSTLADSQETSYDAQIEYFTDYINSQPNMIFAGAYADWGISGTSLHNRDQFNKMMEDCENHKIDRILTKSLSRWSRNTLLSLKTIRRLKELGIGIYFQKENIDTLDAKGELLITILSSASRLITARS